MAVKEADGGSIILLLLLFLLHPFVVVRRARYPSLFAWVVAESKQKQTRIVVHCVGGGRVFVFFLTNLIAMLR